ncbi:MAG: acetyl-CoA synthetase [Mycobacteriales bacterium]
MPIDPRTPCIIGVAQRTTRAGDGPAPEPLTSWAEVARAAAADAGAPGALDRLDSLQVVYCQSWPYDDPPGRLADLLGPGCCPRHRHYSGIGGTTPQVLLSGVAEAMLRGELDLALVVGAEALATGRALRRAGERPAWSYRHPTPPRFPFEAAPHPSEVAHEVFQAWETFPLFDTARRAARGEPVDTYTAAIGRLMAPLTEVAASNPHAWFPVARSAAELVTPGPANRLVGWPYTLHTVAVMDVDMAAAALVATEATADALGVPAERRVYLRGWSYATEAWVVAERPQLAASPAMRAVGRAPQGAAGVALEELAAFDLYSCFPSSLHLACDALGLDPADPRGLTVTGGLPYAGGPASNYVLHSVAAMTERLRAAPGSAGLVTGVGMHLTKHAAAVYASAPGVVSRAPEAGAPYPVLPVVAGWSGPATVAAYTVAHDRAGVPTSALLVCDTADRARCYARVSDPALLLDARSRELVGQPVRLTATDGRNTAVW